VSGSIRVYEEKPLVLFSDTCGPARQTAPAPFPDFGGLPSRLHVFSYRQEVFAPPSFTANECSTPWLLFDDEANAAVISPAAHFMVASMFGDGHRRVASGFNTKSVPSAPGIFPAGQFWSLAKGINRTWNLWGQSLNELRGAKRPAQDADALLKYLSYGPTWRDLLLQLRHQPGLCRHVAGAGHTLSAGTNPGSLPATGTLVVFQNLHRCRRRHRQNQTARIAGGRMEPLWRAARIQGASVLFPNGLAEFQKSVDCRW